MGILKDVVVLLCELLTVLVFVPINLLPILLRGKPLKLSTKILDNLEAWRNR